MNPFALVGEWDYCNLTWKQVAHVNPTFSSDGKRFYFIRATSDNRFEACYLDMSVLTGVSRR